MAFWEIQRVIPSGQDGSILLARVANYSARFGSSSPLAELAIITIREYWTSNEQSDWLILVIGPLN